MWKIFFLFCCIPSLLLADEKQAFLKSVDASLLLAEPEMALEFAQNAINKFPQSPEIYKKYLQAYSRAKGGRDAIKKLHYFMQKNPDEDISELSEAIAWDVIEEGVKSSQYFVRLTSLVSAYLTQDVRAIPIIQKMMHDSNAILRSVAVQLASQYRDQVLQDEIIHMFDEEKVYLVRIELLKAIGNMKIDSMLSKLEKLIANNHTYFEEKALAIQAVIKISDDFDQEKSTILFNSKKAGLRHLFCELTMYHNNKKAYKEILQLVNDPISHVRIAALNALGLVFIDDISFKVIKKNLQGVLEDLDPAVAITAARVAYLVDPAWSEGYMRKWVFNDNPDTRRLAAGAIASLGDKGKTIAYEVLKKSKDPYVRANVALGFIGQRENMEQAATELYQLFMNNTERWMWDNARNPLFSVLVPSKIRHVDQIPSYPEAIDNMAKLQMLSILAVLKDPRAEEAIGNFLRNKIWGITSFAATTLMGEGDDEMLEIIRKLMSNSDVNVSLQAAFVLAMYGKDASAVDVLKEIYPRVDRNRKIYILEAMGYIGKIDSTPFYLQVLEEPSLALRVVGASAFIRSLKR